MHLNDGIQVNEGRKMDIGNRLNELTQATLNFGDVINSTENPSDSDFRNACSLFSQYLESELQLISSTPIEHDASSNIQNITDQLHSLSNLITPNQLAFSNSHHWPNNLVDFCSQLQTLKSEAA